MIDVDPAVLGRLLDARAVGVWSVVGDRLEIDRFWPAPDLPDVVAREFVDATRSVGLAETGLGIVAAVVDRRPRVSVAASLPEGSGSGLWLRRFGASRSLAVPVLRGGEVVGVVSAALPGSEKNEAEVLALIGEMSIDRP